MTLVMKQFFNVLLQYEAPRWTFLVWEGAKYLKSDRSLTSSPRVNKMLILHPVFLVDFWLRISYVAHNISQPLKKAR